MIEVFGYIAKAIAIVVWMVFVVFASAHFIHSLKDIPHITFDDLMWLMGAPLIVIIFSGYIIVVLFNFDSD